MRPAPGVLAFVAGAALVATTAGAAIGQEESPSPDASMAPEASPEAEVVEPSTLEIIDVAAARTAGTPLTGKKLKKAIAKSAPVVARYHVDAMGEDAIGRIIGLSLAARAADEAGEPKAGAALIDIARLLYRNEWSRTKSDPASLNAAIEEAVAALGLTGDAALLQQAIWDRWIDMCYDPNGPWFGVNEDDPAMCADEGGTPVRADFTGIVPDASTSPEEIEPIDAGGLGIHKITMDASANDKLAGKKFKKAWAKALQKHGPTIVGYEPGARGVIEMVRAARAADEAGDRKAAKAYMDLALAAYRSGVPKPDETGAYNESIVGLVNEGYAELPGLELWPPEGMIDVCFDRKGKYVTCVDQASPWECYGAGGSKLERMSLEEATCG